MREEFLNVSWFENLSDARRKAAEWKKEYNKGRPLSALGYLTPSSLPSSGTKDEPMTLVRETVRKMGPGQCQA